MRKKLSFQLFHMNGKKGSPEIYFEEMFDLVVSSDTAIQDLRLTLVKKLQHEKNITVSPNFLRIREMFYRSPSNVFPGNATFKDKCLYNGKPVLIQILDEEEVFENGECVVFIQQWHPSTFTLGPKHEIIFPCKSNRIEVLGSILSQKFNIKQENIEYAFVLLKWLAPPVLEIPQLQWEKLFAPPVSETNLRKEAEQTIASLTDGEFLLFRDSSEPQKELTPEETRAIKQKESLTKRTGEKALTIKI